MQAAFAPQKSARNRPLWPSQIGSGKHQYIMLGVPHGDDQCYHA